MSEINNELILKCVSRWFVNIENNKKKKKTKKIKLCPCACEYGK